jgi:ankyrin repeat protein
MGSPATHVAAVRVEGSSVRTDERVDAALASGDGATLVLLAQQGVDLNDIAVATDGGPRTPLEQVLYLADADLLGVVLSLPGVSATQSLPEHGFWAWAQDAPLPIIQAFLEQTGLDPGHADADGRTLLHEAAAGSGDPSVIDWLLDRVDVDQTAADGTTAFFHAAIQRHLDAAAVLRRHGASPDATSNVTGWTALVTAIVSGRTDVVRWLLEIDGLDVNHADATGAAALHHAARLGSVAAVEALMSYPGADWIAQDHLGRTPLMDAARHGNARVVEALLRSADAGVNMVDVDRRTALHHGVVASSPEVVQLLLDRPDINLAIRQGPDGMTALELARISGDDRLASMIQVAQERIGPQSDSPTNEPPPRPPTEELGDPHEFPGIADPPLTDGGM